MKIELSKESYVIKIGEDVGAPGIWYWVRTWDDAGIRTASECFKDEGEAIKFYDGLVKHHAKFNTYSPVVEILKSAEII